MIPRPETETLVERALARLAPDRALHILDLGTGSGAVALAIASERPQAQIVATEVSEAALRIADANARRLGLYNVSLILADWYDGVKLTPSRAAFDVIVSLTRDLHRTRLERDGYRELAQQAIHALHDMRAELHTARAQNASLIKDLARLAEGKWYYIDVNQAQEAQRIFVEEFQHLASAGFTNVFPVLKTPSFR